MSAKQQLAEAIARFPDTLTVEEAVKRLYQAFKRKQNLNQGQVEKASAVQPARRPGSAKGLIRVSPDFDVPLADFADYQ